MLDTVPIEVHSLVSGGCSNRPHIHMLHVIASRKDLPTIDAFQVSLLRQSQEMLS